MHRGVPIIVGVGGFTSEVGKTTLLCELLRAFPGWEAIKTTRGHYRSCGKDPDACCVSNLLGDKPLVRSGREATYSPGKDTGRYWDAGAANVHWLIATDAQVEQGIKAALNRVEADAVFVEGNSFSKFVKVDLMIMVARADGGNIKASARKALAVTSAIYISTPENDPISAKATFEIWARGAIARELIRDLPVFTYDDLPTLISRIRLSQSTFAPEGLSSHAAPVL